MVAVTPEMFAIAAGLVAVGLVIAVTVLRAVSPARETAEAEAEIGSPDRGLHLGSRRGIGVERGRRRAEAGQGARLTHCCLGQ